MVAMFFLALSFAHAANPAIGSCRRETNEMDKFLGFAEVTRELELQKLNSDPFAYCNEQMAKRALHSSPDFPSARVSGLTGEEAIRELAELQEQEKKRGRIEGGWSAGLLPIPSMKEAAFRTGILEPKSDFIPNPSLDTAINALETMAKADPCTLSDHYSMIGLTWNLDDIQNLVPYETPSTVDNLMETGASSYFCNELVEYHRLRDCSRVLKRMISDMRPRGEVGQVTQPQLYARVLGTGKLDKGLQFAAKNWSSATKVTKPTEMCSPT